jgi:hypothetical protein
VSVATVLPTYKLDMVRMVLVQDSVVKHDAAVRRGDVFPWACSQT